MTVTILPSTPEAAPLQPPTLVLPPVKSLATIELAELERCLAYLHAIYIPEVQSSRRVRPKLKTLQCSILNGAAFDALRSDSFERSHALRWLTACISRTPADDFASEVLLQSAAALLAACAGTASAGTVRRTFAFGDVLVDIADGPLENADFGTVGMQTWGAACVLAEMFVDDPARFLGTSQLSRPIRVLELGAGTGLVSLTIAKLLSDAADVFASDNNPSALANLHNNIASNFSAASHVRALPLNWAAIAEAPLAEPLQLDSALEEPFDLIVGADIVYEAEHARWLHACVARLLGTNARFHLVIPLRQGFDAEAVSVEDIFRCPPGQRGLGIVHKETIVCEDISMRAVRELEYWHFVIEWIDL
jgi:predicted nicotinamide N-methyase